jgi:octaprenyl-diphosphate synthase
MLLEHEGLIDPIGKEVRIFENEFRSIMRSKIGLINDVQKYILKQKSKKIRPILVLLSAKVCGKITESTYRAAALVELLHTATLIHDDVVDDAETRRGYASINALWKNRIAVLIGDYLLSKGLLLSVNNNDYKFLNVISDSVRRMSEGELLQIHKSKNLDIDEKTYYRIISDKTASLISSSCELGALSAQSKIHEIKNMKDFGENLGMAFQIQDDLLDYLGEKKMLGKEIGMDLREQKITLPLIHAFKKSNKSEIDRILKIIKNNPRKKQIQTIIDFVKHFGGIEYAREQSERFIKEGLYNLRIFPDSPAKESLIKLSNFVIERTY